MSEIAVVGLGNMGSALASSAQGRAGSHGMGARRGSEGYRSHQSRRRL